MDDGLIQFLVIAFFIVISMMDGAARKRRKAAQGQGPLVDGNRLPGAEDDFAEAADPSERVLPKDVWGEIAALARGEESTSVQEPPPTRALDTHPQCVAAHLDTFAVPITRQRIERQFIGGSCSGRFRFQHVPGHCLVFVVPRIITLNARSNKRFIPALELHTITTCHDQGFGQSSPIALIRAGS